MTSNEAQELAAVIATASGRANDRMMLSMYAELLMELHDYSRAASSLKAVLRDKLDTYPVPFGLIRQMYYSEEMRQKYTPPALPEPDLTPEQVKENLRLARELIERYTPKGIADDD